MDTSLSKQIVFLDFGVQNFKILNIQIYKFLAPRSGRDFFRHFWLFLRFFGFQRGSRVFQSILQDRVPSNSLIGIGGGVALQENEKEAEMQRHSKPKHVQGVAQPKIVWEWCDFGVGAATPNLI